VKQKSTEIVQEQRLIGRGKKKPSLKGRNPSRRYEEAEGDIEDFNLTYQCKGELGL